MGKKLFVGNLPFSVNDESLAGLFSEVGTVESAKVKLRGKATKINKKTSSDGAGFFEFADLEADIYKIITKKKEYKKSNQTITLDDGEEEEITIEIEKIVEV